MFGQLNLLAALFVIGTLKDFITGLRLVEVRIPNYVIKGSAAQLECLYDLDGEALYSVKWYKDGNEFYRYVPRDMPPAQTFLLPGVKVDLHNSSDAIVTLRDVNLQSAGRFRCEVSGEAPSFQTVTEHGDMVVVSLPDQGPPKISGGRPRYQIGDWVRINCTAGRSKPAVDLSWFVNGEAAEPQKLRKYDTIVSGREGLETSVLGLQFRVEQKHFRNGDMKLKCVASLSTLYWRSNEESVEGDRPQKAPVLESRETVYASNSRADPVQGMSYRELFVTKILSLFIQTNAASKSDSLLLVRAPSALLLLALAAVTALAGGGGISVARPSQSKNKDHQDDEKEQENDKNLNKSVRVTAEMDGGEAELLLSELLAELERNASQSSTTQQQQQQQQQRGMMVTAR
ncbi:uncharacterized protein LOC111077886 isoform X1 [Drosophila obscura]|uniref:uncharacterized protein LOC111077886 isoform X1 n=1 Tax=Drosophila obscura TaxID=7282 RepID=UPI001BB0E6C8|nr:uncharacterized protein LOC111077886 isoform X1 [Drosophila obscura]XP_041452288.1 uncharacterized protein LOC111077886 isoform X1 [Drosophila obscura]